MRLYILNLFAFLFTYSLASQQSKQIEESAPSPGQQAQGQAVTEEVPGEITPTNIVHEICKIAGCYNELCISRNETFNRTCTYSFRDEFSCYSNANCLLNENGSCSWEFTTTLRNCLKTSRERERGRGRRRPIKCVTTGCNNEFCVEERLAPINSICTYRPEFDCLKYTRCSALGNRCAFERNREFLGCLSNLRRGAENESEGTDGGEAEEEGGDGGEATNEGGEMDSGETRGDGED
jgi:eight-cysteine-cluster-containing protein